MSRSILDDRLLGKERCAAIIDRVRGMVSPEGDTTVTVESWWNGELRWARNRVSLVGDRRDITVRVTRIVDNGEGSVSTNQLDDVSLQAAAKAAERAARRRSRLWLSDWDIPEPVSSRPETTLWSDQTFDSVAETRIALSRAIARDSETHGLLSAGYVEVRGGCVATGIHSAEVKPKGQDNTNAEFFYFSLTQAQCSATVRHPAGLGSGWAGGSGYDWNALDGIAIARRALEKCRNSINPVAIEPGRYTVVLEAQAVSDLVNLLFDAGYGGNLRRITAERGFGPFALEFDPGIGRWRTKLGLQIVDPRITIQHDPADPALGVVPQVGMRPITWIENGVLQTLDYERGYGVAELLQDQAELYRPSYRMSGGSTTVDDMITTTERGLLVTRFSGLMVIDDDSLLATGVTRDGLWLIEKGQVSRAVKNMRIAESVLFVFNQVEQLGVPVPVFRPVTSPFDLRLTQAIVPPIKAHDFSFIATNDAI